MPRLFCIWIYVTVIYGRIHCLQFYSFYKRTSWFWFNIKISTHPLYKFLNLNQNSYTELLLVKLYNEKYLIGNSAVSFNAHVHFICLSVFYQWNSCFRCFFVYVYMTKDKSCAFRKQAGVNHCLFWTRKYLAILHYYY